MRWFKWHKTRLKRPSLWKDRSGATAIEFAIVAIPFFMLVLAVIEVGVVHFVNRMVDNAVISASRLIRTGQAAGGKITQDQFKDKVCDFMPDFMCSLDRLVVEVTAVNNFAAASAVDSLYDDEGNLRDTTGYEPGKAGDIVVVNVIYQWPMLASSLGLDKADHDGVRHLTSTMVFRNEPFNDGGS
ncbi:TadE/TadG family type IV pilus assembly protein [Roseibium sp. SCPC15]|uniref:TadE/TadG family type IV pilus assembly protein n=1 Tax=Roseibium sp. SCP15 TaxID=3141376 RepID=UPI00333C8265